VEIFIDENKFVRKHLCSTAKLNQTIPKWNNGFGRRTEFNGRNLLK
jgi:hypothetical protein